MEYNREYYSFSFMNTYFNFNFNVIYHGKYKMKCYLNVLNFILFKNYIYNRQSHFSFYYFLQHLRLRYYHNF